MKTPEWNVVTGALGYTGKYIARRLLTAGRRVKTLTGQHRHPNPFGDQLEIAPLDFDKPERLTDSLRGATTLYNTYWVRFSHGSVTFNDAIKNTQRLLQAAKRGFSGRKTSSSITSRGYYAGFRYSAYPAPVSIAYSRFLWRTWPRSR